MLRSDILSCFLLKNTKKPREKGLCALALGLKMYLDIAVV